MASVSSQSDTSTPSFPEKSADEANKDAGIQSIKPAGSEDQEQGSTVKPPSPQLENIENTWTAWIQCAGAFVAMFTCMGLLNAFGSWQEFYGSTYLPNQSSSDISWIGSLQGFFLFVTALATGPMFDHGLVRSLLLLGTFLIVFGLFMTSICKTYWQLVLAQGVVVGIGMNCVFVPCFTVLPSYFTKNRALVFSIAVSGSSVGGIVYSIAFEHLAPKIGFGWATRVVAFISLALLVVPAIGIRQRVKPKTIRKRFDLRVWKSTPYALLCFGQLLGRIAIYIPYFYVPVYSATKGIARGQLQTYLLTIINGGSLFGRILAGYAGDRFGALNSLIVSFAISGVVVFTWIVSDTSASITVFSALYGFFSGGYMSLGPTVVANICPDLSKLGLYMSLLDVIFAVGILIGPPISGALLDHGFVALQCFCGAAVFGTVAFCIAVRVAVKGNKLFVKI